MLKVALITAIVCILSQQLSHANPTNLNPELEVEPIDYGSSGDDKDDCRGMSCALKGEKGDTGPQGPPGEAGPPGFCDASSCVFGSGAPEGEPGMPGEKGEKGEPGNDGSDGAPGGSGPVGPAGMKGDPGTPGEPGMKGMKGDTGDMGAVGMQGPSGAPGTPGSTGTPGKQGLPGEPGEPGETGRKGTPGEKGQKGESGSTVEIIPREDSEPCNETLQGDIRFDPDTKQLYFCNGTEWVCVETTTCPESPTPDPPRCPSPTGPIDIGNCWYQVFVQNVTQATQDAADIVLVVDESGSMTREQDWLLVMVPFLESTLVANGVGDGDVRNRYCLIGYGSFGNLEPGHFRPVAGEPCFTADRFADAQEQLIAAGLREDGYQALRFGLDNVPFRDSPFIAKNFILVTDEGRDVIPEGEDITRESIQQALKDEDALLNVVVLADYELVNDTMNRTVIGVDARGVSLILEPNGQFSQTNESVHVTKAEKNTAEDYVDLAVSLGGASWALRILRESSVNRNQDIQESFTSALTQIKLREIQAVIESCRKCVCLLGENEDDPPRASCSIANDEQFCRCVVENNGDESTCESGLPDPTEDDRVIGGLVPVGNSISMVPKSPDFMELNSEIQNP